MRSSPIDRTARLAWTRLDWLALAAVTIAGAVSRLPGLGRPTGLVFDEIFYARDACWYVAGSEAVCGISELASRTHPPLGKWLIGSGIAAFGYEPFGWRVTAALAGIVTIALVFVLVHRLMGVLAIGSVAVTVAATAAAGLLATDFLHLVQSRVAMLDVFIGLFVVIAVLAAVLDRDRDRGEHRPGVVWRLTLGRPWRLVAGVFLGAAAATKWSGAYIGLAIVALVVAWEISAERRTTGDSWSAAAGRAFRREAIPSVVLLGVVPLLVYLASYTGRMPGDLVALPWQEGSVWRGIWDHQRAMLDFHTGLAGHHPYESPPWSWPFLKRPVAYFFTDEGGAYREILALGNPLAWWPGLIAVAGVGIGWARRGADAWHPATVIVAGTFATWGPWLVLSGTRSQTFLWYLLPTLPFLYIALGVVAAWLWEGIRGRVGVLGYAAIVLASFAFYFPLLTALPLDPAGWGLRIPFRDCDRPGTATTLELPDDQISQGEPPTGWCWI